MICIRNSLTSVLPLSACRSPGPLHPPGLTDATAAAKASGAQHPAEATRKLLSLDPFSPREAEVAGALQQRLELSTAEVVRLLVKNPGVSWAALFSNTVSYRL